LEANIRDEHGVTVIELQGSVDVSQAMDLRELLGDKIDGPRARVLVDLSHVRLIDSSGIGILVTAHRRAAGAGAAFAIANPNGSVARVLQMTRTDQLLRVFDTVEQAEQELSQG
jgi:anti-anti-sigma factor